MPHDETPHHAGEAAGDEVGAAVDATAFYYQPASEELIDLTGVVLKTLAPMRP
jgi:hypothetical protein